MRTCIPLIQYASGQMIGARESAIPLRTQLDDAIVSGADIIFDFARIEVTQSFIDELIGSLILRFGPNILDKLVFKSCSDNVRAIIEFVVADRVDQYLKRNSH
ncbi:MAG TPA: STAS-like domain-containing protein [Nitrosomonas sp.]|nr:STAS-like domain-containing protein [Nitrosomonas sp.]HQX14695.1 STAS-like domain-containing protein [Nitrosomonas sp.]HRB33349.1 STAS-like domain-containing protein [Nitrosomonas sp.]HRB45961.1 STAS-like domain-containing protein [Nitrosomonas sp.]